MKAQTYHTFLYIVTSWVWKITMHQIIKWPVTNNLTGYMFIPLLMKTQIISNLYIQTQVQKKSVLYYFLDQESN